MWNCKINYRSRIRVSNVVLRTCVHSAEVNLKRLWFIMVISLPQPALRNHIYKERCWVPYIVYNFYWLLCVWEWGRGRGKGNWVSVRSMGEMGKDFCLNFLQSFLETIDWRSCNDGSRELIPVFHDPHRKCRPPPSANLWRPHSKDHCQNYAEDTNPLTQHATLGFI